MKRPFLAPRFVPGELPLPASPRPTVLRPRSRHLPEPRTIPGKRSGGVTTLPLRLLPLLLLAGCIDGDPPTAPMVPDVPLASAADGAHVGGAGFYFLPPMVGNPSHSGTFDAALSPVVEVCATTDCGALHARFSMTGESTASEVVRLDAEDEHYIVNWHTGHTGAVAGRVYRVRIRAGGVVLGYADVSVVHTGREAVSLRADESIAVVAGQALPVRFRIETGIVGAVLVTPDEATVNVGDTQRFTAELRDLHGDPLVGPPIEWSSSDEAVAGVDDAGLATGLAVGEATVTATAGRVGGGALLTVREEPGPLIRVETITAGSSFSCGLSVAGDAYCWGSNYLGTLGSGGGPLESRTTPVAVRMPEGVRFTAISAQEHHTLALSSTGKAYAWGWNGSGQLGDGSTTSRPTPVLVHMPEGVSLTAISAGGYHSMALASTGVVYTWGSNDSGQLGDGTLAYRLTPAAVSAPPGVSFAAVAAGYGFSVALSSTGAAYAWGSNSSGQLGDGTLTRRTTPVAVRMPTGVTFTSISASVHTLALTSTGAAYAWGYNYYGQLGTGTDATGLVPVAVRMPEGVSLATARAGFYHSVALSTTGTVYTWGWNHYGQVGDGTTTNRYLPFAVAVPDGVAFEAIAGGGGHSMALSTTGTLYAWGRNSVGQLGDGTTTDRLTPVPAFDGIAAR
jgi:alpha-tubulin suppressor-like RCC1 family protein